MYTQTKAKQIKTKTIDVGATTRGNWQMDYLGFIVHTVTCW